jgi:hypothetical protein
MKVRTDAGKVDFIGLTGGGCEYLHELVSPGDRVAYGLNADGTFSSSDDLQVL